MQRDVNEIRMEGRRLLTKTAQMYYEENKTQQEIANRYGVSRPSISRFLQKAREKE